MKESKMFGGIFDEYLGNDFELNLSRACYLNLQDSKNILRFNNYACCLRELSRHILKRLAPDENVLSSRWYRNETDRENGITRNQRVKYAIQGGFSDSFVIEKLAIDISDTKKNLTDVSELLNKYTHIEEKTFGVNSDLIQENVNKINKTFQEFFSTIEKCRSEVISEFESKVNEVLIEKFMNEIIEDIDILSTHYSIEFINYNNIKVKDVTHSDIISTVEGDISVLQQWGSDGDLKRGDGVQISNSFPYKIELSYLIEEIETFEKYQSKPQVNMIYVDTDSWNVDAGSRRVITEVSNLVRRSWKF